MKYSMVVLLLAWSASASPTPDFIHRLSTLESANRDAAVGRRGELSRWQIIWYVRTNYPGVDWTDYRQARDVVLIELDARAHQFSRTHHRQPTDDELCLLWHRPAGVDHPTKSDLEYLRRFRLAGAGRH